MPIASPVVRAILLRAAICLVLGYILFLGAPAGQRLLYAAASMGAFLIVAVLYLRTARPWLATLLLLDAAVLAAAAFVAIGCASASDLTCYAFGPIAAAIALLALLLPPLLCLWSLTAMLKLRPVEPRRTATVVAALVFVLLIALFPTLSSIRL